MSRTGGPLLEVRGLVRRYRSRLLGPGRSVLEGLELDLDAGACLGLLGPNGSGKSTFLRIVAGLERPTAGTVRVAGHLPGSRPARRITGFLADDFPFPSELSARGALDLCAALFGMPRRERRNAVAGWLERVGLAAQAGTALGRYSLGMKRRFSLAAALLHAPALVLLDEPSAGLDAQGYVVLAELLDEARARGAALLIATHVPGDLEPHCHEGLVLQGGRIARRVPVAGLTSRDLAALYAAAGPPAPADR
jgi:ABC-2 type transport system ATP-binding protein